MLEKSVLVDGWTLNERLKGLAATATKLVFTDTPIPEGVLSADVSEGWNKSIRAWLDGATFYISSLTKGEKVPANKDCGGMFEGCPFEEIDVSMLDVTDVKSMDRMFADCSELVSLDLSGWEVSYVTDMDAMFWGCKKLATLSGVTDWDVSRVGWMSRMFAGCESLEDLDLSGWDVELVDYYEDFNAGAPGVTEPDWVYLQTRDTLNELFDELTPEDLAGF